MKRLITAVAAALLLAGCQTDPMSMSTTSVDGQWVRNSGADARNLTFQLQTNGVSATGMGVYMDGAKSGTFMLSGSVSGASVKLDLTFDDKTVAHFTGSRTAADMLDGGLKYGPAQGDQPTLAVSFQKATNMMMDDPMGMMMDMMMRTSNH